MSSNSGITYVSSLVSASHSSPLPPSTLTIEKQAGTYVIGQGYLKQPNSSYFGYPPYGSQFPPSSPPPLAGEEPIFGIPQIGNQPYYSPPYL